MNSTNEEKLELLSKIVQCLYEEILALEVDGEAPSFMSRTENLMGKLKNLEEKEKGTSVRDLLSEAIDRTTTSATGQVYATVHINLLAAARSRIVELEQRVVEVEEALAWVPNGDVDG